MLIKCRTALLLTDVPSFAEAYRQLAEELGVELEVAGKWNMKYRVNRDVVILGTKYIGELSSDYFSRAVLILKEEEKPFPFVQRGFCKFIYDYKNAKELGMAFFREEPEYVYTTSVELKELIKGYLTDRFRIGEYDFNFASDSYVYRGKQIYLAKAQKRYLAEWLLGGHKDNKKRMLLCTLRKKFGEDFMKDIDRFGQYKGGQDE